MESDLLKNLSEFPSPFFWDLDESMFARVHEKLSQWKCSEADRLACKNALAFLSYARDNDSLQACRQLQEVRDEDPENLVALTSLAYIDVKHSDVASAETKRKTLAVLKDSGGETQVQKRWAAAMFEKAFCLTRFGQWRYREALGCIEEARKFDSENVEWLKSETFLLTTQVENKSFGQAHHGQIKTFLDKAVANVLKLQQLEQSFEGGSGSVEPLCLRAELFSAARSTEQGLVWMREYTNKNPGQIVEPSVLYEMAYGLCPTDQRLCRKAVLHVKATRDWQKLGEILKKALKQFPDDPLLYHQYGLRYFLPFEDAYWKEKNTKPNGKRAVRAKVDETSVYLPRAEEYFRQALRIDPLFTRCRINLAQCLYHQGKTEESHEQFRQSEAEAENTKIVNEARKEWTKLFVEGQNESGAPVRLCEIAQIEDQAGARAYHLMYTALDNLKLDEVEAREKERVSDYNKQALEINKNTACVLDKGKAAKNRNSDQSLNPSARYEEAYELYPTDQSVCRQAVLHFKAAREWEKMENILSKALKDFPKDHVLYHQYGLRYLIPFELALAEAKKTKDKGKMVPRSHLLKAEEYLREGLKIVPRFTRCRICLAKCLYHQGKVEESSKEFSIAIKITRDKDKIVEARRDWAWLLLEDGNESGALVQLCEALKLKGQVLQDVYWRLDSALNSWCKVDRRDPRSIRVRAALALEAGNEDSAIEYYKEALQIDADDTNTLIGLEKAYKKKGSKVDRHDPRPIRVRAALALEAGNEDSAIEYYKQALQIVADDTNTMIGLEKAYRKKGNFREAKKWFQKASRLGSGESNDH
ncbi:Hypp1018 [Branchiostoma lanceolatum]|uniref:Hypp1018 protein n=1 Tax=Branchiostoma lanceolatum TaxID=7740 RepID=A0A8K0EIM9_BRALA|nr:Hypp1018 [Branchiostoma lanceolatum]